MPAGGTFYDQSCFPYLDGYPADFRDLGDAMGKILWAALVHSPWDHAGDPGFWDTLRARAIELRRASDRALMIVVGCNLFEWGTFLRRMDNFLVDLEGGYEALDALLRLAHERAVGAAGTQCAGEVDGLVPVVVYAKGG